MENTKSTLTSFSMAIQKF